MFSLVIFHVVNCISFWRVLLHVNRLIYRQYNWVLNMRRLLSFAFDYPSADYCFSFGSAMMQ